MELERLGCKEIVAGNLDPLFDIIGSEKGLLFVPGGGIVVGGGAQKAMFKEFPNSGFALEFEPTDAFASQSEDMAWAYGLYRLVMPDGAEDVGKYVSVWIKENGAWKNVAEIRNSGL